MTTNPSSPSAGLRFPALGPDPQALRQPAFVVKAHLRQGDRLQPLHAGADRRRHRPAIWPERSAKTISRAVSQHLGETGAFSDVAYTFQFVPEGMKLELAGHRQQPFVTRPLRELRLALRSGIVGETAHPRASFPGPASSYRRPRRPRFPTLCRLSPSNSTCRAGSTICAPARQDGPIEAFDSALPASPSSSAKSLSPAPAPPNLPALEAAARKLAGEDYSRSLLRCSRRKRISFPSSWTRLLEGCLLAAPQPKVVEDTPEETLVDVTFPSHSRACSTKLSEVQLSGYKDCFRSRSCVS